MICYFLQCVNLVLLNSQVQKSTYPSTGVLIRSQHLQVHLFLLYTHTNTLPLTHSLSSSQLTLNLSNSIALSLSLSHPPSLPPPPWFSFSLLAQLSSGVTWCFSYWPNMPRHPFSSSSFSYLLSLLTDLKSAFKSRTDRRGGRSLCVSPL